MSEFLIDENGYHIWYDLKSDKGCKDIWCPIYLVGKSVFYVRPHREDGAAIIGPNGYQAYCVKGLSHNTDGPARIWSKPQKHMEWYLNGVIYIFDRWCEKLDKSPEEINFLKLKWNII